jgi:hypothetical protein
MTMQHMKRALLLVLLLLASAAFGGEKSEKRQLVSELLEVIDARGLMEGSFDSFVTTMAFIMGDGRTTTAESVPEEYRAQLEAEQRKEEEQRRDFQKQLFSHVDYAKYFDEVYVPMFEDRFTADELRELIAFFRTRSGQKLAKVLPQLGIGTGSKSIRMIREAAEGAQQEMEKEEARKHPWRQTMADMRTVATALEARATDVTENSYPNVRFEELESLLMPTYTRSVPKADSWGTPYLYVADGEHYRFVSAGADKRFEWSSRHIDLAQTEAKLADSLDADIIFQDGAFLQSPQQAGEQ